MKEDLQEIIENLAERLSLPINKTRRSRTSPRPVLIPHNSQKNIKSAGPPYIIF